MKECSSLNKLACLSRLSLGEQISCLLSWLLRLWLLVHLVLSLGWLVVQVFVNLDSDFFKDCKGFLALDQLVVEGESSEVCFGETVLSQGEVEDREVETVHELGDTLKVT